MNLLYPKYYPMLTLLIGIFFGLVFLWVIFFAGRFAQPVHGEEETESEEASSEPWEDEQKDETPLRVWNWDEENDEDDEE